MNIISDCWKQREELEILRIAKEDHESLLSSKQKAIRLLERESLVGGVV